MCLKICHNVPHEIFFIRVSNQIDSPDKRWHTGHISLAFKPFGAKRENATVAKEKNWAKGIIAV